MPAFFSPQIKFFSKNNMEMDTFFSIHFSIQVNVSKTLAIVPDR